MIAHLRGREAALEPLGWTGRQAEWIALVCLHSGVFTRTQLSAHLGLDRWKALRFVRAMSDQRLADEEILGGLRVCRIFARRTYRALGADHIRHRRSASEEVLMRRLLSLDHVIEHTGLPWLPTEHEKVGAFEALRIERRLLPVKAYRGAAGTTRRHFPVKLPVALDAGRAVFVYADPGHDTTTALRSWAVAHRGLWEALRERGRSIEVVAVVRTVRELQRALTILENWTNTSTASGPSAAPKPDSAARREIVRIEQAIRAKDERVLKEYGDLQACLKRIVELNDLHRSSTPRNVDPRLHDMAFEPASRGRILTPGRRASVACRACTSTSGCMCTKPLLPCARQRFRMSLAALRLHHGRRSGDAVPEGAAVDGSDPPSGKGFQRRCQAADHPVRRPSSRCVGATAKDPGGELGTGPTVGGTAPATGNGGP